MEFTSFVLAAVTADLTTEAAARPHADAVEFRLDLAAAPLDQLTTYDGELPVLATNRLQGEGGRAPNDSGRIDTLVAAAAEPSVEAVDVELDAIGAGDADRLVAAAREHDTAIVVSAHDFEGTPPPDAMAATLRSAAATGDVAKLAVTAENSSDVLDLLSVTAALTADGIRVATMAMGNAGRHSRAIAPLYGSRIGYAPVDPADATAPGQYDLATLRRLIDDLGPADGRQKPDGGPGSAGLSSED